MEFGSLPEAVEGGEDHTWEQLLNHLPGTPQATSVLSLGSFLHNLCRMPAATPPPDSEPPSFSEPSPKAEKFHLHPVSENNSGHSPARSFHFQLGELLICSRFCSNPRTCSSQEHRRSAEEVDSCSSSAIACLPPAARGLSQTHFP